MIRKAIQKDLDVIMDIWLMTNINTHSFIPRDYWIDHYNMVKDAISGADVKVYEDEESVKGFVGLMGGYIAGIFVQKEFQLRGIGKMLLDECKNTHTHLTLDVYVENKRAVQFYKNNSFVIIEEKVNTETLQKEYCMKWRKYEKNII